MTTITNTGKRRLGLSGRPSLTLNPGQTAEVTAAQYHSFRENRSVVRWMASGLLAVEGVPESVGEPKMELEKPEKPEKPEDVEQAAVLPEGITGEGVEKLHLGGGWYMVYVNGFAVTDSKVRKARAEEIAAEY